MKIQHKHHVASGQQPMSPPGTGQMTLQPEGEQSTVCFRADEGKKRSLLHARLASCPMTHEGDFWVCLSLSQKEATGFSLHRIVKLGVRGN